MCIRDSSNAAKKRNPLKLGGVPHTRQQISAVSRPKFTILSRYVEEVLLSNDVFLIVDICLRSEDIARHSCAFVRRWRFFASSISSEPRAAHFRPAFQIRTRATPCVEVWQISNLRPLRLGEGKRWKKEEDRNRREKYNDLSYYTGRP